jgi:hypothetical protein
MSQRTRRRRIPSFLRGLVPASFLLFPGCVEQTLSIDSNPPGALVYLNDQEVGRTPLVRDFKWYGDYDIQIRQEGYQTLQTHQMLAAPAWNWVPFDLVASLLPFNFKDHKTLSYTLKPVDPGKDQPGPLVDRAEALRGQLESSPFTRVPTPRATTKPASKPTTRPATTTTAPAR